jgi:hypothetical protein
LHRIVDRQSRGHHAARRIDVHINVLIGVFRRQEEELGDDDVGDVIIDRGANKDNPVLKRRE